MSRKLSYEEQQMEIGRRQRKLEKLLAKSIKYPKQLNLRDWELLVAAGLVSPNEEKKPEYQKKLDKEFDTLSVEEAEEYVEAPSAKTYPSKVKTRKFKGV